MRLLSEFDVYVLCSSTEVERFPDAGGVYVKRWSWVDMSFYKWVVFLLFFFTLINISMAFLSAEGYEHEKFLKWEFSVIISICVMVVSHDILSTFTNLSENERRQISAILAIITYTTIFPPYVKRESVRLWSGAFWGVVLMVYLVYLKFMARAKRAK